MSIASYVFMAGIMNFTMKVRRGAAPSGGLIWDVMPKIGSILLLVILQGILGFIGFLCCCVGAFYVAGVTMFALPFLIDRNEGITDCLQKSYDMLKQHWFLAIVFAFVVYLFQGMGIYACGVGYAATFAISASAIAILYMGFVDESTAGEQSASHYPRGDHAQADETQSEPPIDNG